MHLLSILELFKINDPDMNQCAAKLEAEVAAELAAEINVKDVIGAGDDDLISAAERMQNYLIVRYRRVSEMASSLGLNHDKDRMEEISKAKQLRMEIVSGSNSSMSFEEAFHGQPAPLKKNLIPVPIKSIFRVSHR